MEYIFLTLLIFFLGFRYEIGGDWIWYKKNFDTFKDNNIFDSFNYSFNYGYIIVNWLISKIGLDYYYVNVFSAFILILSLKLFAESFDLDRALCYCIIFPIGIVVIGMGFVRQGCALSFFFISLSFLKKNKYLLTYFFIIIGLTFHKSLLIILPLIFLIVPKFRIPIIIFGLIFIYLFYDHFIHYINIYLGSRKGLDYDVSKGAFIRITLTTIPALLFLTYYKYFKLNLTTKKILLYFSIFILIGTFFSVYAQTFVDRVFYYLVFIQVLVFSYLPNLLNSSRKIYLKFIIVFAYLFILNFFLIYAIHARFWVPYNNVIFNT